MIKKQATNLAAIRKGDGIIAKVYKGDTLRYKSAHSITYNLDGIVTPSQTKVKHNAPFTLSLTTESGKVLLPSTVSVTMGETDITSTAFDFASKTVSIASVAGDVTITAETAQKVEWLHSDGTPFINLLTKLNSDTDVIDMDFFLGGAMTTTSGVFGARTGASTSNFSILVSSTNSIVLDVNNGSYSNYRVNTDQSALNKRISAHLEKANRYVKYDLVLIASSTTASKSFTTNNNAYVFGVNLTEANANIKLCLLQWRRSGNLLFDLIPVRKNGIGYLYDKVSGQLFGNAASTGTFTFGSDVTSNDTNSLNLNNGLLGSTNGDEPNEIDPIAMEDM